MTYCRFCGTLLSEETQKCWNCGLALGVSISLQRSPPPKVEPEIKAETPPAAPELPESPELPELPEPLLDIPGIFELDAMRRPSTGMEMCEIVYENSGMSIRRFVAKADGANGPHEAGRSKNLTGEALFDILDDMAGEKYAGPSNLVQANVAAMVALVAQLIKDGWEPTQEEGEHWWSKKFVRLVETNEAHPAVESPQIWEPWFRTGVRPSFERKLVHRMGFDGKIRLFEVRTRDAGLDALLGGKLFLDFYVESKDQVFLRQLRAPEDWPQTTLLYLDVTRRKMNEVLRSDSSLVNWTLDHQTDSEFTLITDRRSTTLSGYTIRLKGGISFELYSSKTG
jgi:hypothetical protein